MRHTRNRQIMKLEGVVIELPNLPIKLVRDEHWQLDKSFKWERWTILDENREINRIYIGETIIYPMGNYKALKKAQREYLKDKATKEEN
ncbi:hypothetical protein RGU74_27235 [Bacillus cereus]|uniref:hypothetical protein n=1 Tax=Bacillus cereus TaxID=1396 RepID=UPI0028532AAF|nr:hypothetical protein [Bacillus cereus]MDR4987193.1 hypothetical protein [Bacillus cereus]